MKPITEDALWEYASELSVFLGGSGAWRAFVERLKSLGYSEREVDALDEALNKKAGRAW